MPIMKLHFANTTHYIAHPERVVQIYDAQFYNPTTEKHETGCRVKFQVREKSLPVSGVSARQIKRSIQQNTDVKIGFLKLDFSSDIVKGNMYVNVDHVAALRVEHSVTPRVAIVLDDHLTYDENAIRLKDDEIVIDPQSDNSWEQVALQLRRVLNRLDQDEELCCNAPPDADAEAEDDDPAPA